jgi:hypothetical protein
LRRSGAPCPALSARDATGQLIHSRKVVRIASMLDRHPVDHSCGSEPSPPRSSRSKLVPAFANVGVLAGEAWVGSALWLHRLARRLRGSCAPTVLVGLQGPAPSRGMISQSKGVRVMRDHQTLLTMRIIVVGRRRPKSLGVRRTAGASSGAGREGFACAGQRVCDAGPREAAVIRRSRR